MSTASRKGDLLGAIAVFLVVIGMATGNALAMLGMSVAALLLIALLCPKQVPKGAILVTLVVAVIAFVIGSVMAMR